MPLRSLPGSAYTIDSQYLINITDEVPFLQGDLHLLRMEHGVSESPAHLLERTGSSERSVSVVCLNNMLCESSDDCTSESSEAVCGTVKYCNQPVTARNENVSGFLVSFKFMGLINI